VSSALRAIEYNQSPLDRHSDIRHAVRMPTHATALPHKQQPDLSSWPTHTEAAARLATNERTIRRWIESGRLKAAYRPATGRKPIAVVDPEDVERLRSERQQVVVVETTPMQISPMKIAPDFSESDARAVGPHLIGVPADQAAALVRSADPFAGLAAHLTRLAAAFPTPQPKPWLGLAEAAEYSGLPRDWLLAQARAGALRAVKVGKGSRDRWKFNREALVR
jgi:excisionase family DNA binding protein